MSVRPIVLIESKTAEAAQTTQYTCPANSLVSIDKLTVTNYSAADADFTVHLVPSGDSAGDSNAIPKTRRIAAGESYDFPMDAGHWLKAGDFISTLAGTASAMNIRASGRIWT